MDAPDLFDAPDRTLVSDWNLMVVARWMGVGPWELLDRPAYWYELGKLGLDYENRQAKKSKT